MSRIDDMPGYLAALVATGCMTATAAFLSVPDWELTQAAVAWHNGFNIDIGVWGNAGAAFLLLWIISVFTTRVNRRFNIEEGTSALPSSIFLCATASVPGFLTGITPPVLMALTTIISLLWMFAAVDREQKAQPLFLVGTLISFGTMAEYAFIPAGIGLLLSAHGLGLLNLRSIIGFIIGLITPWVLMLGYGVVTPGDLSLPDIYVNPPAYSFTPVMVAGVTAVTSIIILLHQAVTPSNRSSRSLALNRSLNIILVILIIAMGVDFRNFIAYIPTVALLTGFAVASLAGNNTNSSTPNLLIAILIVIYILLFIFAL